VLVTREREREREREKTTMQLGNFKSIIIILL
jgi:hypothetical protein